MKQSYDTMRLRAKVEALVNGQELTIQEIDRLKLIPWAKSHRTIRRLVMADIKNENLLKVTKRTNKHLYIIKAGDLKKYMAKYAPAFAWIKYENNQ